MMVLMGDPPVADGRELPGGQHVERAFPASPLPSVFASPRAERFVPRRARQAPSAVGLRLWCERARADSLSGRRRFEPGPSNRENPLHREGLLSSFPDVTCSIHPALTPLTLAGARAAVRPGRTPVADGVDGGLPGEAPRSTRPRRPRGWCPSRLPAFGRVGRLPRGNAWRPPP